MTASSTEEQHRQALLRFVNECVNTGNFNSMDQIFASDHVMHSPTGDLDRAGVAATLMAMRAAFPDFQMTIDQVFVEGDRAATLRHIRGTFTHEFPTPNGAIPPNGKPIVMQLINTFRFNDAGLVVEEWTQYDNLGFLTQLGVMPAPPA